MSPSRWSWAALKDPSATEDLRLPDLSRSHAGRGWTVDALAILLALGLGALFLSPELNDNPDPRSGATIAVDVIAGVLACVLLWWRRRWPLGVAILCAVLGAVSTSATPAGLVALSSLALHRPARFTVAVLVLWIPSVLVFAAYSPTTGAVSVVLLVMPLALAASGWGMFIRARRQLLWSLRERALRAEADRELHKEQARVSERTRIAREMHDVLAHRISLIALHAGGLELRPDLPPAEVQETAALLGSTARQALEELRSVIGVLRDQPGQELTPAAPQPTLRDINRLIEERRAAGAEVEFDIQVERIDDVPAGLGRDTYRIVQEALTNVAKHAPGTAARVQISGAPNAGLHVSVRNRQPASAARTPPLPGSGAGLLGLQERVSLAGGTIALGPDVTGDFVVEADLTWHA